MIDERRFDILSRVVEIATTSVDVSERLQSILGVVQSQLEARLAVLFMLDKSKRNMVRASSWPRELDLDPDMVVPLGNGVMDQVILRRKPAVISVSMPCGDDLLNELCSAGELVSLLPVCDDSQVYGVLVLVMSQEAIVDDNIFKLLQMIAREIAGTVRNSRLYMEAKRRIAELNVISDLGLAAISTIEVDELLDTVASMCAKLLGAGGGLVAIEGAGRTFSARYGTIPKGCPEFVTCVNSKPSGPRAAQKAFVPECNGMTNGTENSRDRLCVHLSFKGSYSGNLCVFNKVALVKGTTPGFNVDDQNLLGTMASMVAPALENALTFHRLEDLVQRNEEMVNYLATLHEISTILMTTVDFEETVMIILVSLVHQAGLDYDNVILFLADDKGQTLLPVADLSQKMQVGTGELSPTLNIIKQLPEFPPRMHDNIVSELEVPIKGKGNILTKALLERKPLVKESFSGRSKVDSILRDALEPKYLVAVPMIAKDKNVGVLVASTHSAAKSVDERGLRLVDMLANQAALALETSRLYQNIENANRELAHMRNRLLEADKLAALGEIAAGVAHEIRNPLVSIGGFTRRIRKRVGDDSPITPYLEVIIEEVTRLERTLNEMLEFSSEKRDHFEENDLNEIIDRSLDLLRRDLDDKRIEVVRHYSTDLPKVFCDERQIKHVFLNLFINAIQAMDMGGRLTLRTFTVVRESKQFVAGEVSDTGGGIPMDVVHHIFNPFFTTKDQGSGMGLSIVHKIVTRHFGGVEVHNREGEGTSFLVTLPAAEEGRAYLK